MSTEYNVIVFDKPNADRTEVRPHHVSQIPAAVNSGLVKSVGALYTDESKTKFAGSAFHIVADSKDQVIAFLKKDIYYEKGIWDIDSVLIHPIGVAARLPKVMNGVNDEFYKL